MGDTEWNPITEKELPHLVSLGGLVRGLREEFGLTQRALALLANVSASHISAIERARRRSRRSTLERIVGSVITDEDQATVRMEELLAAAGPALGLEENEAQRQRLVKRLERRHRRQGRQGLDETISVARSALRDVRRLAGGGEVNGDLLSLAERFEEDLVRLEAQKLEFDSQAASRDRDASLRRRPDKGPAWHELQDYARSLLPPGRATGRLYPSPEQQRRLEELSAAARIEEANRQGDSTP